MIVRIFDGPNTEVTLYTSSRSYSPTDGHHFIAWRVDPFTKNVDIQKQQAAMKKVDPEV
jgi:hypothetical protein